MVKKWIQSMHMKKGALRRKAKAAGKSTMAFAREHEHDSGRTGKQARLAETLSKLRKHKRAPSRGAGR